MIHIAKSASGARPLCCLHSEQERIQPTGTIHFQESRGQHRQTDSHRTAAKDCAYCAEGKSLCVSLIGSLHHVVSFMRRQTRRASRRIREARLQTTLLGILRGACARPWRLDGLLVAMTREETFRSLTVFLEFQRQSSLAGRQ